MKARLSKTSLTASLLLVLATALTLSCSNDDDKDSFGSCKEATKLESECWDQIEGTNDYVNCMSNATSDKEMDACDEEFFGKCFIENGICGSASAKKCYKHFIEKCWLDDYDED